MDSVFDSIKTGTLYAAQELVGVIEQDESITPAPPVELTYDENGELIPPETGGPGPEAPLTAPPEAENAFPYTAAAIGGTAVLILAAALLLVKRRRGRPGKE